MLRTGVKITGLTIFS